MVRRIERPQVVIPGRQLVGWPAIDLDATVITCSSRRAGDWHVQGQVIRIDGVGASQG